MITKKRARKIQRIFVCVFFSLFFCGLVSGQYRFDIWTTNQGLPQNTVRGLIQSKDGYIWGATNGGIFRFDGVRFTVFNNSNTEGLEEARFWRVIEDGDGRIWFMSEKTNLVKLENGEFTTFSDGKGYEGKIRSTLLQTDEDGNLVFQTDKYNYKYKKSEFSVFEIPKELGSSQIKIIGKDGSMWFVGKDWINTSSKTNRVARLANDKIEYFRFPQKKSTIRIPRITQDSLGNIWGLTAGNFNFRIRNGELQELPDSEERWGFTHDQEGNLWLGGHQNLEIVPAKSLEKETLTASDFKSFDIPAELKGDSFSTSMIDQEGSIWMGTFKSGLVRISPIVFKTFSRKDWKTTIDAVYPVFEDSSQNIWLGLWSDKIVRYNKEDQFRVIDSSSFKQRLITTFYEDSKQRLWIGSIRNLGYYEGDNYVRTPIKNDVYHIIEDETGILWMAGERGLIKYENDEFQTFTAEDGLSATSATALLNSTNNGLLIGTKSGLTIYSDGKFEQPKNEIELENDSIRSLYEDNDGVIWIGTYANGLVRYKNGQFKRITDKDGLSNENVFCTLEDKSGRFWINTNKGIYNVNKQQLNDFADGKINRVQTVTFLESDGLVNTEGNGGMQPSGLKRSNGEFWFPTQRGVAIVDPDKVKTNPLPPPVMLEEISVNDKDIGAYKGKIELKPEQNNLKISYTGLSFINSELLHFRYRLEGLEENWTDAETRRTAFYNNLPPGEYTFKVLAANRDGVWNSEGASIMIVKYPHFYQTWWFLILSVLLVAAIVSYIFYNRISALRKIANAKTEYSRRVLESQEAERKRIASELHDGLGQELIIIKNQAELGLQNGGETIATKQFEDISETASIMLDEVRSITNDLRPHILDKLGLTKSIKAMIRKVSGVIAVESRIDDIDGIFSEGEEIHIYRIVQESLNNVVKHSNASDVIVRIKHLEGSFSISVEDNGKGFDPETVSDASFGLIGLRERSNLLGGKLTIDSYQSEGTTVKVVISI